jgi:hypothetical protein
MSSFGDAARLGQLLSKPFAGGMFRLLASYPTISASEVASRLDIHIQTAQSFLETLTEMGVVEKTEHRDKTRPYARYALRVSRITLEVDFAAMGRNGDVASLARRIRERRNSGARFVAARQPEMLSTVVTWEGTGRARQERRITLTRAQGLFLFNLPMPGHDPVAVIDLITRAGIDEPFHREVLDIVDRLVALGTIEAVEDGTQAQA